MADTESNPSLHPPPSVTVTETDLSPTLVTPQLQESTHTTTTTTTTDLNDVVEEKEEASATATANDSAAAAAASSASSSTSHKMIIPHNLLSFKEESNNVSDLSDPQKNSLQQLKNLLTADPKYEVSIWGVPLLKDDRTDIILLKFLRARDFKVKDALTMITNTLTWRKDFDIDALIDEDLGDEFDKVVFMHGYDREGHPVCYNVYGEFQNNELYHKAFSNQERTNKFLRWRIQFLERSIRNHLHFTQDGINTILQVNDFHNSPGPAKRQLRIATKQALQLLQDNYPEFVSKQVFINVPWWYLAFYTMISPFMTHRTKSKFVFAGPSKSPDTLFKYISPEQVPVQYGGLSVDFCDCNPDFSMSDPITEIPLKPNTKQTVEIAIYERCIIVWELRVVGWEVSYSAEFKPDAKDGYTVIIQKATKMSPTDEPVISNSFKVGELGKLFLTVDNPTLKKKRILYRFKIKPYSD
ncbi:hypothetical protein Lal_00035140 [Lupinus albus]|nr:hypothetical protein Lal_00035140 [Lupinus albus]